MFIHSGVYSIPAGTYQGEPVKGIGERIMNRGKIPVADYRQYTKEFNPVKSNADEWVRTARDAGFKVAKLGRVEISSAEKVTLTVSPVKDGWRSVNLKAIRLGPVAAAQ
jgi:hypothetical protein